MAQQQQQQMPAPAPEACYAGACSPHEGRHLVAARQLDAGAVVLRQAAYAAVLADEQVPLRCDHCFAASAGLMRCSRSKFAHYCSQGHQSAAWRAYYRQESAALVACAPHVPPATVRLAARVLWRRASELASGAQQQQQQPPLGGVADGGSYADVLQLQSHWERLDDARKVQYAQMAVLTRQYMLHATKQQDAAEASSSSSSSPLAAALQLPDAKQIAQLLARLAVNNHTICDAELRPIGVGLFPLGALLNHGCRPSCTQSFEGPAIVFRALRQLPAGTPLTISYIELAATRQERARQLARQYFFDIDAADTDAAAAGAGAADCTRLRVGLAPPALQQQQPAEALGAGAISSGAAELLSYASSSSPPWRTDPPDGQLCRVLLAGPVTPQALEAASWRGSWREPGSQLAALPGGMCLLLAAGSAAGGGAAASLFTDLEQLADAAASGAAAAGGVNADGEDGAIGRLLVSDDSGEAAVIGAQQQQQQQEPELQVVQWGDWGSAAAAVLAAGGAAATAPVAPSTAELASEAASVVLMAHALQQAAERSAAQGQPGAAVQQYLQARSLADGLQATDPAGGNPGGSSSGSSRLRFVLGPLHILRARVNSGLLKAVVDEGARWELALAAARSLTPVYKLVYPRVSPNLGLHYATLAKLELLLHQAEPALAAARAAEGILRVTHAGGDGTGVLQQVQRLTWEAQQEVAYQQQMEDMA